MSENESENNQISIDHDKNWNNYLKSQDSPLTEFFKILGISILITILVCIAGFGIASNTNYGAGAGLGALGGTIGIILASVIFALIASLITCIIRWISNVKKGLSRRNSGIVIYIILLVILLSMIIK